jgi:hypothetical protein
VLSTAWIRSLGDLPAVFDVRALHGEVHRRPHTVQIAEAALDLRAQDAQLIPVSWRSVVVIPRTIPLGVYRQGLVREDTGGMTLTHAEQRAAPAERIAVRCVDSDVHPVPRGVLLEYIPEPWHQYFLSHPVGEKIYDDAPDYAHAYAMRVDTFPPTASSPAVIRS